MKDQRCTMKPTDSSSATPAEAEECFLIAFFFFHPSLPRWKSCLNPSHGTNASAYRRER